MTLLVLGLILFLGVHSVAIVAPAWRDAMQARLGEGPWKGLYSLASAAGFVLIVIGYGIARQQPIVLYTPPLWLRHVALLLLVPVFPLLLAVYLPGRIKSAARHPMLLATKLWALAHLLANGNAADVLLFGGFLAWAVASFTAARKRDNAAGVVYLGGHAGPTVAVVVAGGVAWAGFAFWAHAAWIGVRPFG